MIGLTNRTDEILSLYTVGPKSNGTFNVDHPKKVGLNSLDEVIGILINSQGILPDDIVQFAHELICDYIEKTKEYPWYARHKETDDGLSLYQLQDAEIAFPQHYKYIAVGCTHQWDLVMHYINPTDPICPNVLENRIWHTDHEFFLGIGRQLVPIAQSVSHLYKT